ncbi:MAG: hypothetical protein Kow0062_13590 [Acidobacteriota bacterium]
MPGAAATAAERPGGSPPDLPGLTLERAPGGDGQTLETLEARLAERPGDAELHARYAFELERAGRPDDARRAAQRAEALAPDDPRVKLWIARMHDAGGRWAESALAALAAVSSPLASDADRAEGLFIAGTARSRLGDLVEAERLLRRATEIDPWNGRALMNLGIVLYGMGRAGEGLNALLLASRRAENDGWLLIRIADVLDALGRRDLTLSMRRRIVELRPDDPRAHRTLGLALVARREIDAALAALRRAAELAPQDAEVRTTLAQLLLTAGRDEEAARWAREAVALGDASAQGILRTIETKRAAPRGD